jgi:hypothetical protein
VNQFVDAAIDSNELMVHQCGQFGPINVGFQMRFALNELAIHQGRRHRSSGTRHRPDSEAIDALVPVLIQVLGGLPVGNDAWELILKASGR